MFYKTDDPVRDFERHDAEQEAARELLPICEECEGRIEDDFLYNINDCLICEECLNKHYRKRTTDYIM